MYLASTKDIATIGCFFDDQITIPLSYSDLAIFIPIYKFLP